MTDALATAAGVGIIVGGLVALTIAYKKVITKMNSRAGYSDSDLSDLDWGVAVVWAVLTPVIVVALALLGSGVGSAIFGGE